MHTILNIANFFYGVRSAYPICFAFTLMFGSLGMLGHVKGLQLHEIVVMSATIFAVPLQAILLSSENLSVTSVVFTACILQFKFLLMSTMLLAQWQRPKWQSIPSLHFICASTYAVTIANKTTSDLWSFYLGVALPSYLTAILATIGGFVLWESAYAYKDFLYALAHIVLPIHFICLAWKRYHEKATILATYIGAIITPLVAGNINGNMTVLLWVAIAMAIVYIEEKLCGQKL